MAWSAYEELAHHSYAYIPRKVPEIPRWCWVGSGTRRITWITWHYRLYSLACTRMSSSSTAGVDNHGLSVKLYHWPLTAKVQWQYSTKVGSYASINQLLSGSHVFSYGIYSICQSPFRIQGAPWTEHVELCYYCIFSAQSIRLLKNLLSS